MQIIDNISVNQRIDQFRVLMNAKNLDAYIIPGRDPHQSEYLAAHWQNREWISGFSGSAGTVVITADHAGLWTDSRYFIQAEQELADSDFELHRLSISRTPQHLDWLKENLPSNAQVGCNGKLFSVNQIRQISKSLASKDITIVSDIDLVAEAWKNRPTLPQSPVFRLDEKYAGKSCAEKINTVRSIMDEQDAEYYLVSTLDDIAWMFNLRGDDIDCNPVFMSYALIGKKVTYLFIDPTKVTEEVGAYLRDQQVIVKDYSAIEITLQGLQQPILIDRSTISINLFNRLQEDLIVEGYNIISHLKTQKNETEINQIRIAMTKDGVALTKLFMWLEQTLEERSVPEVEVAERLAELRKSQGNYFGESFNAIVGYQGNGAIVHYHAQPETCAQIEQKGILLLDSGGQYLEGTTDITRTVALSPPTDEQKKHFTLVLQGHIALAKACFPKGTVGVQLDILARQFLWNEGINYGHGTGHGVGYFLNVHEGPQGISPTINGRSKQAMKVGMLTSNEPGFYKEDAYGIRIENLIVCRDLETQDKPGFLDFETVTLFPIDQQLIEKSMLSQEEKDWLNTYHEQVQEKLLPRLNEAEQEWLKNQCRAV